MSNGRGRGASNVVTDYELYVYYMHTPLQSREVVV